MSELPRLDRYDRDVRSGPPLEREQQGAIPGVDQHGVVQRPLWGAGQDGSLPWRGVKGLRSPAAIGFVIRS